MSEITSNVSWESDVIASLEAVLEQNERLESRNPTQKAIIANIKLQLELLKRSKEDHAIRSDESIHALPLELQEPRPENHSEPEGELFIDSDIESSGEESIIDIPIEQNIEQDNQRRERLNNHLIHAWQGPHNDVPIPNDIVSDNDDDILISNDSDERENLAETVEHSHSSESSEIEAASMRIKDYSSALNIVIDNSAPYHEERSRSINSNSSVDTEIERIRNSHSLGIRSDIEATEIIKDTSSALNIEIDNNVPSHEVNDNNNTLLSVQVAESAPRSYTNPQTSLTRTHVENSTDRGVIIGPNPLTISIGTEMSYYTPIGEDISFLNVEGHDSAPRSPIESTNTSTFSATTEPLINALIQREGTGGSMASVELDESAARSNSILTTNTSIPSEGTSNSSAEVGNNNIPREATNASIPREATGNSSVSMEVDNSAHRSTIAMSEVETGIEIPTKVLSGDELLGQVDTLINDFERNIYRNLEEELIEPVGEVEERNCTQVNTELEVPNTAEIPDTTSHSSRSVTAEESNRQSNSVSSDYFVSTSPLQYVAVGRIVDKMIVGSTILQEGLDEDVYFQRTRKVLESPLFDESMEVGVDMAFQYQNGTSNMKFCCTLDEAGLFYVLITTNNVSNEHCANLLHFRNRFVEILGAVANNCEENEFSDSLKSIFFEWYASNVAKKKIKVTETTSTEETENVEEMKPKSATASQEPEVAQKPNHSYNPSYSDYFTDASPLKLVAVCRLVDKVVIASMGSKERNHYKTYLELIRSVTEFSDFEKYVKVGQLAWMANSSFNLYCTIDELNLLYILIVTHDDDIPPIEGFKKLLQFNDRFGEILAPRLDKCEENELSESLKSIFFEWCSFLEAEENRATDNNNPNPTSVEEDEEEKEEKENQKTIQPGTENYSFKPQINAKSRTMIAPNKRPVWERLYKDGDLSWTKHNELYLKWKRREEAAEYEECTFRPKINKYDKKKFMKPPKNYDRFQRRGNFPQNDDSLEYSKEPSVKPQISANSRKSFQQRKGNLPQNDDSSEYSKQPTFKPQISANSRKLSERRARERNQISMSNDSTYYHDPSNFPQEDKKQQISQKQHLHSKRRKNIFERLYEEGMQKKREKLYPQN
eukprot:TRINITY_DN233358_c0_g3_i1.p1 TRINITY_DN233358_c0_g3~~TRINITY_DN233358_c0_g3_i1.p1  ORF type:complete len:1115 (+),score=214.75 TRINITY_DN233358_c0_g3_i1:130-3474(+)